MVTKQVSAADFKARCLKLMDQVQAQRTEVVITKRGRAVAKLVPVDDQRPSVFGCMAGTFEILGDLIEPVSDPNDWEANR